jgi:hypothetical protein
MGPRLPIDEAKSFGRQMYIDRSRQFAAMMQRLDELERLGLLRLNGAWQRVVIWWALF